MFKCERKFIDKNLVAFFIVYLLRRLPEKNVPDGAGFCPSSRREHGRIAGLCTHVRHKEDG